MDDGSVAVSLNLKLCLVPDPVQRQKPLTFQERNELILPKENNLLQSYISDTEQFAIENKMIINPKNMGFNKNDIEWNGSRAYL